MAHLLGASTGGFPLNRGGSAFKNVHRGIYLTPQSSSSGSLCSPKTEQRSCQLWIRWTNAGECIYLLFFLAFRSLPAVES